MPGSKYKLMHRVFGKKEKAEYLDRTGAYLIPIKEGKIAVVKTPKGLFFLGGGKEPGEISEKVQEPLETDHQLIWMEYSQLKGNLFVEMQNWALEQCWREYEKNEF